MSSGRKSEAVAAIEQLIKFIQNNPAGTLNELFNNLKMEISKLAETEHCAAVMSIRTCCELFVRFITLANLDHRDIQASKSVMVARGSLYLQKVATSREKIANIINPFITNQTTILTHGNSRVVRQVLITAAKAGKRFQVYVTQSAWDNAGELMKESLESVNILTVVILDSAVGYIMEQVDFALVGAEGVVESGGIINKIGTFTIAICAREMHKPFYVVAESFKFARLYPLNQQDVPNEFRYKAFESCEQRAKEDPKKLHPTVDYTPPSYITLLFTELGVLTPSAVSDELIKLYL